MIVNVPPDVDEAEEDPHVVWLEFLDRLNGSEKIGDPEFLTVLVFDGTLDSVRHAIVYRKAIDHDSLQAIAMMKGQGWNTPPEQGGAMVHTISKMMDDRTDESFKNVVRLGYTLLAIDPRLREEMPLADVRFLVLFRRGAGLNIACADTKEDFAKAMIKLENLPQGGTLPPVH